MELNILNWNINFINNSWKKRVKFINKLIKNRSIHDIICLQEVTIPFSKSIKSIYNFVGNMDYKYDTFLTRNLLYKKIESYFPENKILMVELYKFIMDKIFLIVQTIICIFGSKLLFIYLNFGFIGKIFALIITLIFPLLYAFAWTFFGMLTLVQKKLNPTMEKEELGFGRTIQYSTFKYNKRDILLINVQLSYKKNKSVKKSELRNLIKFVNEKKKDIVIICGDFKINPTSKGYNYMKKKGFKSAMYEYCGEEKPTYPAKNPKKCIDYVWYMGEKIKIKKMETIGNKKYSNHLGLNAIFEIM